MEIDHKVLITGIVCLTFIFSVLVIADKLNDTLCYAIVGVIALICGVFIPTPKIDNTRGVFKW